MDQGANANEGRLIFPAVSGRTYHIQSTTNVSTGPWINEVLGIGGVDGWMWLPRTNAHPRVYYRIGVETP